MDYRDRKIQLQLDEIRKLLELVDAKSELQLIALKQLIKVWSEHYEQTNADRTKSE
jgi:DNA-binding transcriptional MerR regulator